LLIIFKNLVLNLKINNSQHIGVHIDPFITFAKRATTSYHNIITLRQENKYSMSVRSKNTKILENIRDVCFRKGLLYPVGTRRYSFVHRLFRTQLYEKCWLYVNRIRSLFCDERCQCFLIPKISLFGRWIEKEVWTERERERQRARDRRLWKFWKSKNYKQVLRAILGQINSNGRLVNNTQRRYIRTKSNEQFNLKYLKSNCI